MTAATRLTLACALALAAAGCKNRDATEGNNAVSEVLPGSASDAMIPYDTLRSQPPLAPVVLESGAARDRSGHREGVDAGVEPTAEASAAATGASSPATREPVAAPPSVQPAGAAP